MLKKSARTWNNIAKVSSIMFYSTLKAQKLDRTGALKGEDLLGFFKTPIQFQIIKKI